jgi:hypothetical protein
MNIDDDEFENLFEKFAREQPIAEPIAYDLDDHDHEHPIYDNHSLEHDLDFNCIVEIPHEQGYYDNGWQTVLIWCRTHRRWEWQQVDSRLINAKVLFNE